MDGFFKVDYFINRNSRKVKEQKNYLFLLA